MFITIDANTKASDRRLIPNNTKSIRSIVPLENKDGAKKIAAGLACLAAIGIATAGLSVAKKHIDTNAINKLNYQGMKAANDAVNGIESRGKDAVELYKQNIAKKKASVLQYKMKHLMLLGKSKTAHKQIMKNKNKLAQMTCAI